MKGTGSIADPWNGASFKGYDNWKGLEQVSFYEVRMQGINCGVPEGDGQDLA